MASAELGITPSRALDANANVYSGAVWRFYQTGTTTPLEVYSDADLNTSLGAVVTADSAGKFPTWYFDATKIYRGVCKNSTGSVTLHDIDPINSKVIADLLGSGGSALLQWNNGANGNDTTVSAVLKRILYLEDYLTAPYDTTDNTANVQQAFDDLNAQGGGLLIGVAGQDVSLGALTLTDHPVNRVHLNGYENIVFDGQGMRFTVQTNLGVSSDTSKQCYMFRLSDCSNIVFRNVRAYDGWPLQYVQGSQMFFIEATTSDNSGGILLDHCEAHQMLAFVTVGGLGTGRVERIHFDDCYANTTYYGINFQNNGDLVSGTVRTYNCRRAYFPYGVQNHDLTLFEHHTGGVGVYDANAHNLIVRETQGNTANIRARIFYSGSGASLANLVKIEHQNSDGPDSVIQDIYLDIHIAEDVTDADSMIPVRFASVTGPGGTAETTTDKIFRNIHISGNLGPTISYVVLSDVVTDQAIDLHVGSGCAAADWGRYGGGYYKINVAPNKYYLRKSGDLTAAPLHIDLTGHDTDVFIMEVTTWAHGNYPANNGAGRNSTLEKVVLVGVNAGGSGVTLDNSTPTPLYSYTKNTASTIAYAANGEGVDVSFTSYNGTGAVAVVWVEHIGPTGSRIF